MLVGVLAFAVAAPIAVAARTAYVSAGLVGTMFQSSKNTNSATRPTLQPTHAGDKEQNADPWADKPRLNILLLGGDAGKGRVGTRTDTVILASIDTKTGDTTLFSLPRNTARMPFPSDSPLQAATTPTASPTATPTTPSSSSTRCTATCRSRCRTTSSARPTTSAPTS